MCQRVTCSNCGRPTYIGCGRHVEAVLHDVPLDARCSCEERHPPVRDTAAPSRPWWKIW